MKKLFSERGAALVLVIFLMVVLVSFGILAMTSAAANRRLSAKTLDWRTDYYALDAQAADIVHEIDGLLLEAELHARESLGSGPLLHQDFAWDYLEQAREKLTGYMAESAEVILHEVDSDEYMLLEVTIEAAEKTEIGQKYLTVQLAVFPPEYIFPTSNAQDARRAPDALRYRTVMWQQWQQDFDYEYTNPLDFWDGMLNK